MMLLLADIARRVAVEVLPMKGHTDLPRMTRDSMVLPSVFGVVVTRPNRDTLVAERKDGGEGESEIILSSRLGLPL